MFSMALTVQIIDKVKVFLDSCSSSDRAKIVAAITVMEAGTIEMVVTRQISGSIRELKVKQYRILYFQHESILYFVGGFTKKSQKTPLREIENAKQIRKIITQK